MNTARTIAALLGLCTALTSCSSLLPPSLFSPTERQLLILRASPTCTSAPESRSGPTLIVRAVTGAGLVASRKILFSRDSASVGYYQRSTWVEPPTAPLTRLLRDELECTGAFSVVSEGLEPAAFDLSLAVSLSDFRHVAIESPGNAMIVARAELVQLSDRKVLAAKAFTLTVPCASYDAEGAARALAEASSALSRDIAAWVQSRVVIE